MFSTPFFCLFPVENYGGCVGDYKTLKLRLENKKIGQHEQYNPLLFILFIYLSFFLKHLYLTVHRQEMEERGGVTCSKGLARIPTEVRCVCGTPS